MVVVADAGMLSAANLKALDEAGLRFIVGSRQTKAPHDLATHFRWHGTHHAEGTTVDPHSPCARHWIRAGSTSAQSRCGTRRTTRTPGERRGSTARNERYETTGHSTSSATRRSRSSKETRSRRGRSEEHTSELQSRGHLV